MTVASPGPQTIRRLSPAAVAALRAEGRAVALIDVRTPAEFAALHAQGARSLPLDELDSARLARGLASSSAADEPIYVICQSGARAAKVCERLAAAGCANAVCVDGGTVAWEAAGLPVVRGPKTISLERQVRIAAGALVLVGVTLGTWVHPWLYGLSAFVGAGLVFAGITDFCGMGMLLARMPWNRRKDRCS